MLSICRSIYITTGSQCQSGRQSGILKVHCAGHISAKGNSNLKLFYFPTLRTTLGCCFWSKERSNRRQKPKLGPKMRKWPKGGELKENAFLGKFELNIGNWLSWICDDFQCRWRPFYRRFWHQCLCWIVPICLIRWPMHSVPSSFFSPIFFHFPQIHSVNVLSLSINSKMLKIYLSSWFCASLTISTVFFNSQSPPEIFLFKLNFLSFHTLKISLHYFIYSNVISFWRIFQFILWNFFVFGQMPLN